MIWQKKYLKYLFFFWQCVPKMAYFLLKKITTLEKWTEIIYSMIIE